MLGPSFLCTATAPVTGGLRRACPAPRHSPPAARLPSAARLVPTSGRSRVSPACDLAKRCCSSAWGNALDRSGSSWNRTSPWRVPSRAKWGRKRRRRRSEGNGRFHASRCARMRWPVVRRVTPRRSSPLVLDLDDSFVVRAIRAFARRRLAPQPADGRQQLLSYGPYAARGPCPRDQRYGQ